VKRITVGFMVDRYVLVERYVMDALFVDCVWDEYSWCLRQLERSKKALLYTRCRCTHDKGSTCI
jgi:hypothetical protein